MLKNFNKALNQKSQNSVQQILGANQKGAVVAASAKTVATKGISKHEQMELLNLLEKCTQIMKDDRLNLRNLIKDGQGQEVEEIIQKHKKKQDISSLTLDLRKYINKSKFRGGQTPTSNNSIAPPPNQKGSQVNLQPNFGDQRQSRKTEQDSVYRQQKTFSDALNVQQNNPQLDENMQFTFEQQRMQQQLQMQMRQQQQQLMQQQQYEQQLKQQNQNPQKMSPFRRPQNQQIQELNNTNSPLKQSNQNVYDQEDVHADGYGQQQLQQSYANTSQSRCEQVNTEYNEGENQSVFQMQQQSVQNQQVEVNENEESTLRKRLQETQNDEGSIQEDQQQYEQEMQDDLEQENQDEQEYQQQQGEEEVYHQQEEYQFNTQSEYSQNHLSELKQNCYESQQSQQAGITESGMVTQNSQELTTEQQNQYMQNLDNYGQQNYFQQQFSSQMRRSSLGQSEGQIAMSDQQMEQAIYEEQQRILQQEEEMERVKREREEYIQQAIQRSEQSRFGNFQQNDREDYNQDDNQNDQSCRDENESDEENEEFFDQINDLGQKEESIPKPNLIKFGSLQRGNSYQTVDDPVTPMNHPVHMDSGVQYAPVKHRIEEMTQSNDDPFSLQKRLSEQVSNIKSQQYSDVKQHDENVEQRYQQDTQNSKRNNTQESGSKYEQNSYSQNKFNSVRKSNNDVEITTELIQHNFEVQMEKAYMEQQLKSAQREKNNLFEEKSFSSAYGQQTSAEKQQFNHLNLFNCAMSGFDQESVQQAYSSRKEQQGDQKAIYNIDNYVRSATNQFTQPNEEIDDSCSINFANEKVELKYNVEEMLESSVRESNLQNAPQPTYMPKSEILKVFSNEQQPFQQSTNSSLPIMSINTSNTLNVVQKTYDNYYAERVAIDLSGNQNLFQKKTTPSVPVNIYSTPSQSKYQSIGVSQEQNSNGKIYSSSVLPPSILRSPAFRREYLRGTADPSANKDRVTSMLSPSREYQKLDPSKDPIKKKYNHLFTSPQLMKQCNVEFERENIGISYSPESQKQFVNSERELIEQETKEFLKRSVERSAHRVFQTTSNVFSSYEPQEIVTSRLRDSSIPKKSINFARSPYSTNLKESMMTSYMKQSIQLPMFLASANICANTDKAYYVSRFSLYNKTAQEVFDVIFGNLIFQDKVTKMAFRNRMVCHYPNIPTTDIDGFFDFLDINQDQVLEANEVGPVLMSICDYKSKENGKLIQVFNFLDIDRKGFITRLEAEHLLHSMILKKNYHNSALNLSKQLFREVDIEQKGYLTYWELYSCKQQESIKQLIDVLTS